MIHAHSCFCYTLTLIESVCQEDEKVIILLLYEAHQDDVIDYCLWPLIS